MGVGETVGVGLGPGVLVAMGVTVRVGVPNNQSALPNVPGLRGVIVGMLARIETTVGGGSPEHPITLKDRTIRTTISVVHLDILFFEHGLGCRMDTGFIFLSVFDQVLFEWIP